MHVIVQVGFDKALQYNLSVAGTTQVSMDDACESMQVDKLEVSSHTVSARDS